MKALTLTDLEKLAVSRATAGAGKVAMTAMDHASQAIITMAIKNVFLSGLGVLLIGFIATLLIPAAQLRGARPHGGGGPGQRRPHTPPPSPPPWPRLKGSYRDRCRC